MSGRFTVSTIFKATDRITAPVARMQGRLAKFTTSTQKGFVRLNRTVDRFGTKVRRGGQMAAVGVAAVGAAMVKVLSSGADFEQAITDVGAVSLKTRAEIAPLEKMALDLGRSTKFTATQAAQAMEIMARAGFDVNDTLAATPGVLSAAAASGLEIAEVADHVSNVLKGMGLETSEAARVADVLALASSRTNSSIGSLGESMSNVASTARQLGIPLEDAVASVALLQDVGLDASVAGSALNTMLTKMAAPTKGITDQMDKLGLSFKDAKGDMKSLPLVLDELSKASKAAGGNFDQVAFLAELVGLRGQKAAANLTKLFENDKIGPLVKDLENATGVADKMASLRMDTLQGSMLLLGSAIDAVKVKIFGLNDGGLKEIVDKFTMWVGANEDLMAQNIGDFFQTVINGVVSIAKNAGALIEVAKWVIGLVVAFKALTAILTIVNLLMVMSPVGLAIAAFVALAAIAAVVIASFEPLRSFFSDLWGTITGDVKSALAMFERLKGGLKSVKSFFGFEVQSPSITNIGKDDGDSDERPATAMQKIVTPQERVAKSIEENTSKNEVEVTVKSEAGRPEITGGKPGPGFNLITAGGF